MTAAVPSRMRPQREIPHRQHRCPACYDTGLVAGNGQGLEKFLPCTCEAGDAQREACEGLRFEAEIKAGRVTCGCGARASVITGGLARCGKCSRKFVDEWRRKR